MFYSFIFREKERERNINVSVPLMHHPPSTPRTGDVACNPGMCPD